MWSMGLCALGACVSLAEEYPRPTMDIDKQVEGDFRLPVWLNRDSAALWLYPVGTPAQALDLEIAFKARETGAVPCAPLRVRLTADDRPLKVSVPIARWPDGDYLTTVRVARGDGAKSGELQRLLRAVLVRI